MKSRPRRVINDSPTRKASYSLFIQCDRLLVPSPFNVRVLIQAFE